MNILIDFLRNIVNFEIDKFLKVYGEGVDL